jgi:transposase InsO family protein
MHGHQHGRTPLPKRAQHRPGHEHHRTASASAIIRERTAWARRIVGGVGGRVSRPAAANFVRDALEQAMDAREPAPGGGLIHPSDRGFQRLSSRYTERLGEAGIAPALGRVGDSRDNAVAETVIGRFKTAVIRRLGPWRSRKTVAIATLEWVDGCNHRRLPEPIAASRPPRPR